MLILLVEDDADLRSSLADILKLEGHQVIMSPNGADALEKLTLFVPDVVLLDLLLPEMSGEEFLKRKRFLGDGPGRAVVVIISGLNLDDNIKNGEFACLRKPFNLDTLLYVVKQAGEKRRHLDLH